MSATDLPDHYYAEVRWNAEDIKTLKPDWTTEQCQQFHEDNERHIQSRLTELGWEVIQTLLP